MNTFAMSTKPPRTARPPHSPFFHTWIPALLLTILLLTGCVPPGSAFSPENAAANFATRTMGFNATIISESVQVRQKIEWTDRTTMVMVSFDRLIDSRQESCLMTYETRRESLGMWSAGGGGGGCTSQIGQAGFDPGQPLDVGGGQNGGSTPADPGFSYVNGLVYQDDIQRVRVTWDDGQQQTVEVTNKSYLALRAGQFGWQAVEGLNAAEEVIFGQTMETAPGKEIEP